MKKILLASILLGVLVGCSNKNENVLEKPDVSLNAGIGIVTGTGEFGELGPKDSKILTVRIANTGDEPLVGPPTLDNTDFSIIYQSGCASINPGKACTMKISFSAAGKAYQAYSANLNLDSAFLALSATVVDPNPTQTASVAFSADPLDFGTITDKQSVLKNLIITNSGTTVIENQAVSLGADYAKVYDNCSNKRVLPGKNCLVKLQLVGTGKSGAINNVLSFAGQNLNLVGTVVSSAGPSVLGEPNVKLLISNVEEASYDYGSLTGTESKQVIVVAKNVGNKASDVGTAQLLANADFSILFNQCNNRSLAPGASCQIRVLFNATGKSPTSYGDTLSFVGKSLTLSAQVSDPFLDPPCLNGYVENGVCLEISEFKYRSDSINSNESYNYSTIEVLPAKMKPYKIIYTNSAYSGVSRRLELIVQNSNDEFFNISENQCIALGGTYDMFMGGCSLPKESCLKSGYIWETYGENKDGSARCWHTAYIGNFQNHTLISLYDESFNDLLNFCGYPLNVPLVNNQELVCNISN